ncbi:MAG: hypothetical protein EON51_10525 [Acinetobacter sp.]|nr:MAG: hypothetical protein EON51_10525 [Acinetobacter sp.]
MKYSILSAILVCFLLASAFSFIVGFYKTDLIFFALGVLLALASILIFLEIKNTKNDPFS